MEICANCFKEISSAHLFCPHCGYPNSEVGSKRCTENHIIYETYRSCPFCERQVYTGKATVNLGIDENNAARTEHLEVAADKTGPQVTRVKAAGGKEAPDDHTVLEADTIASTVLESDLDDRTRLETMTGYPDKTVLEEESDRTILDSEQEELPRFFAWLVYIDEEGKPLQDVRLTRPKNVIGKGVEADIRLEDDFASKLHAVVYLEEGQFFLSDLGSTNHTWLNEKKIMNETLNDGDRLRIGHQSMIFKQVRRAL